MVTRWHGRIVVLLAAAACSGEQTLVDGRSLDEWRSRLRATDVPARCAAMQQIARFGAAADPAVVELADRLALAVDGRERAAAARALRVVATPRATAAVRDLLASPTTSPASYAETAEAGRALLPVEEFDGLVRGATVPQLGATLVADQTYLAVLPPGSRRRDVLLALALAPGVLDARAEDALVRRLADLGADATAAVPRVARALEAGRNDEACIDTLVAIGDAAAARVLCEYTVGRDPARRAALTLDLGELLASERGGAEPARAALHASLEAGEDPRVRRAAIAALAAHGGEEDLAALTARLSADDLAADALDATLAMLERDAIPTGAARAAWVAAARSTADPGDARRLVRALVVADRGSAEAAIDLAALAQDRPELADAVLTALDELSRVSPEAAFAAAAQVLAIPELPRRAVLTERFFRRLAGVLGNDRAPAGERAAAARRLAVDSPERAVVAVSIGERRWTARLRLGTAARTLSLSEEAVLHVPPGPLPVEWLRELDTPVIWFDDAARPTMDAVNARFALTLPAEDAPPEGSEWQVDRELWAALAN